MTQLHTRSMNLKTFSCWNHITLKRLGELVVVECKTMKVKTFQRSTKNNYWSFCWHVGYMWTNYICWSNEHSRWWKIEGSNEQRNQFTQEYRHLGFEPFPKGIKIVSFKWVFWIKQKVNWEIDKFKAKQMAKGFTQTHGVYFGETFTLVEKFISIYTFLWFMGSN